MRKPLRIIRTLDPSALELTHAMVSQSFYRIVIHRPTCSQCAQSVQNVWPNKIEYSITTPTKAVIFGTTLRVDFRLLPLLKGLEIGDIRLIFIESHDLTLNPEDPEPLQNNHATSRVIIS